MRVTPESRARLARAWRRMALTGLLAGVALLSPAIAWATFANTAVGGVSVGSATLPAPASLTLAVKCTGNGNGNGNGNAGSVKVTFPNVALASSYQVRLDQPSGTSVTTGTTSGSAGATFTPSGPGTYLVSVTSLRQSWTSAPVTQSFVC